MVLKNNFALLHNITSMLRIGDFSYISTKNAKLTALGELKSKEEKTSLLRAELYLIGTKKKMNLNLSEKKRGKTQRIELNKKEEQRLKRQKERMSQLIVVDEKKTKLNNTLKIEELVDVPLIEKLIKGTKPREMRHIKYDDGLIISVYKVMNKNPIDEIYSRGKINFKGVDDIGKLTKEIFQKGSSYNALFVSAYFYKNEKEFSVDLSQLPLLWSSIEHKIAKEIYFQNVRILVTFNPAAIIEKLRLKGYDVEIKNSLMSFSISKTYKNSKFIIEDFNYYLNLIVFYLVKEKAIINMVEQFRETIQKKHKDFPKKVMKIKPEINLYY